MADTDYQLGLKVQTALIARGIETPMTNVFTELGGRLATDQIQRHVKDILGTLGMDLTDDSLKDTPLRVSKMYAYELFAGLDYNNFPKCTVIENKMQYDEVVICKDIDVLSVCEHHLVPFIGKAFVGYIPETKIIGLSKFNRIVDFFSRRPQVQERLTEQVWQALSTILETNNIMVVIKADHMCTKLRGVKATSSSTVTSKNGGRFRESDALRNEFLTLAGVK